jgi:hypothetical protein
MDKDIKHKNLFTAAVASALSGPNPVFGGDFKCNKFTVFTTDTGAGVSYSLRVRGSDQAKIPDFTSAPSSTNKWSYRSFRDENGNLYDSSAAGLPIVAAGSATYEINENQTTWWVLEIFSYANGQCDADATMSNNQ